MTKIERIDAEIQKIREKITELQAKIRTLEAQKTDEENAVIVQTVRKLHMTPADLARFLERHKNNLTNPAKAPFLTALKDQTNSTKNESEENT